MGLFFWWFLTYSWVTVQNFSFILFLSGYLCHFTLTNTKSGKSIKKHENMLNGHPAYFGPLLNLGEYISSMDLLDVIFVKRKAFVGFCWSSHTVYFDPPLIMNLVNIYNKHYFTYFYNDLKWKECLVVLLHARMQK